MFFANGSDPKDLFKDVMLGKRVYMVLPSKASEVDVSYVNGGSEI